jgi:hypothetical protein
MPNDNGKKSPKPPLPKLETIDSEWDEDASGEIPIPSLELDFGDAPFEQVPTAPKDPSDSEHRSGVQSKEDRPSHRPTPPQDLELELPPLVTPDMPESVRGVGLTMDEPGRPSYDDLSLELGSGSAPPDPMLGLETSGGELELELDAPHAQRAEDPALAQMRDRYAAGDFTGALVLAESLLETEPDNDEVQRYAQSCRDVLTQMYAARLGPLEQVVSVAIPPDQVRWLSLDHRSGFLLSLVDGVSSIEEILDISGMTRLDALRIMFTLLEQQIISLSGR